MQTGPQENIVSPFYVSLFFSVKLINVEYLIYLFAHCSLLTIRVQPLENKRKKNDPQQLETAGNMLNK